MSIWTSCRHLKWRARISPKRLIIAATSSRPLVRAAAAAGHSVVAADLFSDADTRSCATRTLTLTYRDGGFDRASVFSELMPALAGADGFVFGSGFETQPDLIEMVARECRVYGNDAKTVAACKNPVMFFSQLASLGIAFPETRHALAGSRDGWLCKRIGGSGGVHIRAASDAADDLHYFQRQVAGEPCSLLFLADGRQVMAVGYNRLLLAPVEAQPYRYGGVVSRTELPQSVKDEMLQAAEKLTAALHLRGLNSLDCLVDGDHVYVLEINPRPSASFALYDAGNQGAVLFDAHLLACDGCLSEPLPAEPAQAHLIYYAPFEMSIAEGYDWPEWAADLPAPGTRFKLEDPLCSVTASAETADLALAIAEQRLMRLKQDTHQFLES